MSSYYAITRHPKTHQWLEAAWIDNHFGQRKYGVKFQTESTVYNPEEFNLPQKKQV
jgi:hypothetical protein